MPSTQDTESRALTGPQPVQVAPASPHTDRWYWIASYEDGTRLAEMDDQGMQVAAMAHVDQSRLRGFVLIPRVEGLPRFAVHIAPGEKVIFFRRRRVRFAAEQRGDELVLGEQQGRSAIHVLGVERPFLGRQVQTFLFIFESGHSVIATDREALQ